MPLLYAGPTQINAMVPFDVPSNGAAQVVVQVGLALAVPEDITVAPAAPGAFTLDSTGTGPAIAVDIRPDGSGYLTGPTAPAHPGDALVIYCGGIGGVQSSIEAGQATPLSPLTPVTDAVSVTIGGVSAQVDYAGLVATLSGLYQVNIRIPSGISGDALPLVITVAGQTSRASTIAVR